MERESAPGPEQAVAVAEGTGEHGATEERHGRHRRPPRRPFPASVRAG